MRRHPVRRVLDLAELVLVAAEALGADPEELLDGTDLAELARVEVRLRAARTVEAAMAAALVAVATGRPFPYGNRPVAWLVAAHLAALNGLALDPPPALAGRWLAGAEAGDLDDVALAAALGRHLHRPSVPGVRRWGRSLARRLRAAVATPERPVPPVHTCPLCQRALDPHWVGLASAWQLSQPAQRIWGCVRQHGVHDGSGLPLPDGCPDRPARRCPLVLGPDDGRGPAFVALTDRTPVAFRPAQDDRDPARAAAAGDDPRGRRAYDLVVLDDLPLSALVGSWDRLWSRGRIVGRVTVPGDAVRAGAELDWSTVEAGSPR